MHPLLDKYLCDKYPKIFAERNLPMDQTCMCWGFPGDGWFFLLDKLCENIQSRIDNPGHRQKKCLWNIFVKLWIDWVWNKMLWHIFGKANKLNRFQKYLCPQYKYEKEVIPQVVAQQVKEKFGTLRFYHSGGNEEIRGMVDLAESLTYRICEDCGRFHNDVGQTPGWIHTVCNDCLTAEQKSNKVLMAGYKRSVNAKVLKLLEKAKAKK